MPIKKQHFPVGMILILILVGWGAFGLLFSLFNVPVAQLGTVVLVGAGAVIVNMIIIIILATIFFGILKRRKWARILTIVYYIFSMVLVAVNALAFMANQTMYNSVYRQILAPQVLALMTPAVITASLISALAFGWVIGIIILVYIFRKKSFFTN